MADMTELKNIVRLGTVQSVNASKMTARVKFKDKGGITSGDLRIIKRPVYVVPAMESGAEGQTAKTTLKYDYNGQMLKEVSHNHEAFVTEWTPGVNDMVLCIMVPDGDGDGFIIGELISPPFCFTISRILAVPIPCCERSAFFVFKIFPSFILQEFIISTNTARPP